MSDTPTGFTPKTFWERPEGTMGMLSIGLLGVAGFFLVSAFLPTLLGFLTMGIAAVGKAIVLTGLCAVLGGILWVATNPKFQVLVSYMFKSIMRKVTGAFVEIDPIGIMMNYVKDMKERLGDMDTAIEKLRGQLRVCKNKIATNVAGSEQAMAMAAEARKKDKTAAFTVNARQAGRLEKLNNDVLLPMERTMEVTLRALTKYREVTDTVILDMQNEVVAKRDERDMILASHTAMRAAQSILQGDQDKKELFDQAMEYVVNDYGQKIGEIENFIETSRGFVDGLDLQNGVYEADAYKKLQDWETKADSLLLGDNKRLMLEQVSMGSPLPAAVKKDAIEVKANYDKFLK